MTDEQIRKELALSNEFLESEFQNFETVKVAVSTRLKSLKAGRGCLVDKSIFDYVYGEPSDDTLEFTEISEERKLPISEHLRQCEYCTLRYFLMKAEKEAWDAATDKNWAATMTKALGEKGMKKVLELFE